MSQDSQGKQARNRQRQVQRLRRKLPENVLRSFDHLVLHGRSPVAMLSETGACGSCHLKLPPADTLDLRRAANQLHPCPHCGCFLHTSSDSQEADTRMAA